MSNYVKLATEATDSYFATLTETQDSFLKAISAFPGWVPAPPSPAALGFAELPTMQEITEASFSFSQKFLRTQQDFVEKLIATSTSPATANASARNAPARAKSAVAS
jgi:hypothetical protein